MSSVKVFIFLIYLHCVNGNNNNRYCAFEHGGEAKYYICHRNEYCCRLGCCVNLAFQFYQMWYYWLLLIFMFMVCSGGGWWYRFCRQPEGSSYPTIAAAVQSSTLAAERHHAHVQQRRQLEQQTRRSRHIHINSNTNDPSTVYLQRIWKGPSNTHHQPPPNYYSSSSIYYQNNTNNSSATANLRPTQQFQCPYYQLYGPPPSYESVVQLSDVNGLAQPQCMLIQQQQQGAMPTTSSAQLALNIPSASTSIAINSNVRTTAIHEQQPSTSSNDNNFTSNLSINKSLPINIPFKSSLNALETNTIESTSMESNAFESTSCDESDNQILDNSTIQNLSKSKNLLPFPRSV